MPLVVWRSLSDCCSLYILPCLGAALRTHIEQTTLRNGQQRRLPEYDVHGRCSRRRAELVSFSGGTRLRGNGFSPCFVVRISCRTGMVEQG